MSMVISLLAFLLIIVPSEYHVVFIPVFVML